ncbi:MAG: hypothetical protein E7413_02550 [Ruminococcaceae bacterium]|nr:hypothetical protein [Oscillospiraceae bacterium]
MKKERLWISSLVIFMATLILLGSFFCRIQYENNSRQAFMSVDIKNLASHGKATISHLHQLKDAGANVVTVEPQTIKGLEQAGKVELISYSSLFEKEDARSQQIITAFGDNTYEQDHFMIVVTDPQVQHYLSEELSCRYEEYTSVLLEDQTTMVFVIPKFTGENDLVVGYDKQQLELISEADMSSALVYPSYTFENPAYTKYFERFVKTNDISFLVLRNNPYDNEIPLSEEFKNVFRNLDITLVVWENESQIGNETPFLYDDFFSIAKYRTLRGFHMDKLVAHDESGYRYRYYQWFNSALERNTKFIHANLLENPDMDAEANFKLTLQAISDFKAGLRNYDFPKTGIDVPYVYPVQTASMAGGLMLLSLAYLYLVIILRKIPRLFTEIYFILMVTVAILSYAFADFLAGLYAFGIMVMASAVISALLLYLEKNGKGKRKYLWMILSSLAITVSGIVSISSLLGGIEFYTSTKLFHGTVLSMLLPFAFAVFNGYMIYLYDSCPVGKISSVIGNWCKKGRIFIFLPIIIAAVVGFLYYCTRIGNYEQLIPLEDHFRKWLTDVFYVRPRTKEFLFGYPLLALFYYCSAIKTKIEWKLIFGIGATVLFNSIFNTFCHTFTAVTVSIHRVYNGFLCGFLVSFIVIVFLLLIRYVIVILRTKKN